VSEEKGGRGGDLEGGGCGWLGGEDQGAGHAVGQLREGHHVQQTLQDAQGTQREKACRCQAMFQSDAVIIPLIHSNLSFLRCCSLPKTTQITRIEMSFSSRDHTDHWNAPGHQEG